MSSVYSCRLAFLLLGVLSAPFVGADFKDAQEALKAKNYEAAAAEFRSLAELGNPAAAFAFADMLARGQGGATDPVAALAWFELAKDQGSERAEKRVRKLASKLDDTGKAGAQAQAAKLIADHGRAAAGELLIPEDGGRPHLTVEFSDDSEYEWPIEARGRYQATLVEVDFDVSPEGVPRDVRLVREVWAPYVREVLKVLRTKRYPEAAGVYSVNMRVVYPRFDPREQYGNGRLLRKLKKRAETGSPYRKFYYARAQELAENFGYVHSVRDSNDWFLQAAQGGYAKAQYIVGLRTLRGHTLRQDQAKGLRWIGIAAGNGDERANYFVARSLISAGDPDGAKSYLSAAAEAGHTAAMLWLARILAQEGDAVAWAWVERAADHLDRVSWHLVAAEVSAESDAAEAEVHRRAAARLTTELGQPQATLEPLVWKDRTRA